MTAFIYSVPSGSTKSILSQKMNNNTENNPNQKPPNDTSNNNKNNSRQKEEIKAPTLGQFTSLNTTFLYKCTLFTHTPHTHTYTPHTHTPDSLTSLRWYGDIKIISACTCTRLHSSTSAAASTAPKSLGCVELRVLVVAGWSLGTKIRACGSGRRVIW